MARQTGNNKFTGTIEGLVCYKMYGDYFVRTKSSLTGKRFWKDKAFEGSRKSCNLLAKASTLTSSFYKTYAAAYKRKGLFNEMTGKVKLWLKEGKTEQQTLLLLQECYAVKQIETKKKEKLRKVKPKVILEKKGKLFAVPTNETFTIYKRKTRGERWCFLKE